MIVGLSFLPLKKIKYFFDENNFFYYCIFLKITSVKADTKKYASTVIGFTIYSVLDHVKHILMEDNLCLYSAPLQFPLVSFFVCDHRIYFVHL